MFKIPLVNIIGDEGMGYFNSAYTVYTLFYTLSTAGLPVAVSIMISECIAANRENEKKGVYKVTFIIFLIIGLFGFGVMFFMRNTLASLIGSPFACHCLGAMSAVLLFVCISSGVRGYFQGHQIMTPTAVSSVIESGGKLIFGILFALYAIKKGYPSYIVAAFAVFGITASSMLCALYLLFSKTVFDRKNGFALGRAKVSYRKNGMRLLKYAMPITLGSVVMSLCNVLDLAMVIRRLVYTGLDPTEATAVYGNYSGLCVPLFNMPSAVIAPIGMSVVPYISGQMVKNEGDEAAKTALSAIRTVLILSFPCMIGLALFAKPILRLIFNDEAAMRAYVNMAVLAFSIVGVALTTVTTAILQGHKRNFLPVISMTAGSLVKLISGYFLIGRYGMIGTPISTFLCYMTTSFMNLYFLRRHISIPVNIVGLSFKPFLVSLTSALVSRLVFSFFLFAGEGLACMIAIAFCGLFYFGAMLIAGGIKKEDLTVFPGGEYINKVFFKS